MTPSQARIDAALRLAEAVSLYAEMFTDERAETRQWPDNGLPRDGQDVARGMPRVRPLQTQVRARGAQRAAFMIQIAKNANE